MPCGVGVAGEGWWGRRGDGKFRNVCRALIPAEGVRERFREAGQGLGGGCKGFGSGQVSGRGTGPSGAKGFGSGGVGGRDTGPRDGANFATCVVFLSNTYKKKKNGAF